MWRFFESVRGSFLNRDFVAWKENSGNINASHVTKISRFKNHLWFTSCFHAKFVETQQNAESQHSPLCFPWWLHSTFLFFFGWTVKFPKVSGVTPCLPQLLLQNEGWTTDLMGFGLGPGGFGASNRAGVSLRIPKSLFIFGGSLISRPPGPKPPIYR